MIVVGAMVLHNLGTVVVLGTAGIGSGLTGVALWPASSVKKRIATFFEEIVSFGGDAEVHTAEK